MTEEKRCDLCIAPAWIFGVGIQLCRAHYDELEAWNRAVAAAETTKAGGPWTQTCPRRMEDFGPWERAEDLDKWAIHHDAYGTMLRSCSFCGSLHPDDFMDRVHAGDEVGPTDKNYKVYMQPNHNKFYFQHLSVEQRHEFVELLNAGTMNIGYPGHFYRLPFFCRAA